MSYRIPSQKCNASYGSAKCSLESDHIGYHLDDSGFHWNENHLPIYSETPEPDPFIIVDGKIKSAPPKPIPPVERSY